MSNDRVCELVHEACQLSKLGVSSFPERVNLENKSVLNSENPGLFPAWSTIDSQLCGALCHVRQRLFDIDRYHSHVGS
jgi:hypothetical protein